MLAHISIRILKYFIKNQLQLEIIFYHSPIVIMLQFFIIFF